MGSIWLHVPDVFTVTFTPKMTHLCIGKYTSSMDCSLEREERAAGGGNYPVPAAFQEHILEHVETPNPYKVC